MRYRIVPKRDFGSGPGYWLPGAGSVGTEKYGHVKRGFVVTDGLCNIMPGATWFRTIPDAMLAINIHMQTGDTMAFWDAYRNAKAVA